MTDIVKRLRTTGGYGSDHLQACNDAADEIERLRAKVSHLTKLLDDQNGTPCEQIRHQQEIEQITDVVCQRDMEIEHLRAALAAERERCAKVAEDRKFKSDLDKSAQAITSMEIAAAIRGLKDDQTN